MGQKKGCKVISIMNQKGGVGKTTMAFNIAYALKLAGQKVLCVDMDPQANLSLLFGVKSEELTASLFHLLVNSVKDLKSLHRPLLLGDVIQTQEGVDILPASQELASFDLTFAGINSPRQLVLQKFMEKSGLRNLYDYIVIDGPPTLGLIMVNILCASDGVLVPFQPDQFSRKGLGHFHEVLADVEDMGIVSAPKIIGYIPNLMELRRKQSEVELGEINEHIAGNSDIPGKVFSGFPNRVQLVKSLHEKKSVFSFESKEYEDIKEKFREIAQTIQTSMH